MIYFFTLWVITVEYQAWYSCLCPCHTTESVQKITSSLQGNDSESSKVAILFRNVYLVKLQVNDKEIFLESTTEIKITVMNNGNT